ncbi:MAG: CRISPR-associated helicase/endonuclease Cas3 [Methyloprofundus sp.]|nr:CRISPR-associated helicase/endonuclease Cas3 [Methyloprofundus sp.]
MTTPLYYQYWGKACKEDESYHLLPYHCLDVVAVADIWLQQSSVLLNLISQQIGLSKEQSKSVVLFFVALHDLGKFDARFQNFVPKLRVKLQGDDYEVDDEPYSHGPYGYYYFEQEFSDTENMKAVAGHHGFYDESIRFMLPDADEELIEQDKQARKQWIEFCLDWFKLDDIPQVEDISMLAGLCSVSDWVGSSITNFTQVADIDLKAYFQDALPRAEKALKETGMLASIQGSGFGYLFPDYVPRGIQGLLPKLSIATGLTIVESDTGSGKTEFALAYASELIKQGLADGIVFGLPTQATANGLFDRIGDAANKLFPDSTVTLAHSKSKYLIPDEDGFLHQSSKRAFLGSMSVATVDQILMGVLGIKHQFVRSFGTRKSVLILDEIHSFDAYMYGLIEKVLRGQHEAYSSVILLSATLPINLKRQLLDSYQGEALSDAYPLITQVDLNGKTSVYEIDQKPEEKQLQNEVWISSKQLPSTEQCQQLIEWAEAGAMVGVICNTVKDAQLIYSLLADKTEMEIDLFHARYTVADRRKLEDYVLNKYGKTAERKGGLLIATQVIEQSLDLDFDVLVSQIAPIEFLMQRMGRLWRHDRLAINTGLAPRAAVIKQPLFITLCPVLKEVEENFETAYAGSGFVYKNIRVLYRTQKYLESNEQFCFPACYREAINHIHHDESYSDEPSKLSEIVEKFNNEQDGSYYLAKMMSNQNSRPLNDVDPRSALLTREGELSQAVVLFKSDGDLLHGGSYDEQQDREKSTVSLSNKLAKGKKDTDNYCFKAVIGKDLFYNELGVFDEQLQQDLENY